MNTKSKLDKAATIVARFPNLGRAKIMQKFVAQLEMTETGASTYFYLAQKRATEIAKEKAKAEKAAQKKAA